MGFFVAIGAAVAATGAAIHDRNQRQEALNKETAAAGEADARAEAQSDALMYMSDANKTTALFQIESQASALQQAALDREMQLAANLELGIEKFDTKLQTSKLDYIQQMTAEENRHTEKLAKLSLGSGPRVHVTSGSDIPEPSTESSSSPFDHF